jgi:NAD(P)-dependent dehydrogenase (short-subunit alcohol dehydrogenase family)
MNVHKAHADSFTLDGGVALITGAVGGLGLGYATASATAGAHVVLNDRDTAVLAESVKKLTEAGYSCIRMAVRLDVGGRDHGPCMFETDFTRYLVNNPQSMTASPKKCHSGAEVSPPISSC